ncbi:hypothetical protein B7486_32515 [cyanobacterium TDX16]|nr:hypothetical protein B7486_32515 [cyanobacterium TDX16]
MRNAKKIVLRCAKRNGFAQCKKKQFCTMQKEIVLHHAKRVKTRVFDACDMTAIAKLIFFNFSV